jgi:hypothetical protein
MKKFPALVVVAIPFIMSTTCTDILYKVAKQNNPGTKDRRGRDWKGWKNSPRSTSGSKVECICGLIGNKEDDERCKELMKKHIELSDNKKCAIISVVKYTGRQRKQEMNPLFEILHNCIPNNKRHSMDNKKIQEIYIRPHHFHDVALKGNNLGPRVGVSPFSPQPKYHHHKGFY